MAAPRRRIATTYRYNELGQRIAKQVGAGNTEVYLLEDRTPLGVFTVSGAGAVVSSYFNLLADTRVVGRQPSAGSRSYYHTDLLGSTRAVVQGATVTESYDYDPWGVRMLARSLGSGTKEQFTTKERDAESQLDYFGARSYASAIGRWTSVDPAEAADSVPQWGPYAYVRNNPGNFVDQFGKWPDCTPWPQCSLAPVAAGRGLKAWAARTLDRFNDYNGVNQAANLGVALRDGKLGEAAIQAGGLLLTFEGGGSGGLAKWEEKAIQRFSDKYGVEVTLTGSRARGTAGPLSDFDYIISGNSKVLKAARRELPRGVAGGETNASGRQTGIDVFRPDERKPTAGDITFTPKPRP